MRKESHHRLESRNKINNPCCNTTNKRTLRTIDRWWKHLRDITVHKLTSAWSIRLIIHQPDPHPIQIQILPAKESGGIQQFLTRITIWPSKFIFFKTEHESNWLAEKISVADQTMCKTQSGHEKNPIWNEYLHQLNCASVSFWSVKTKLVQSYLNVLVIWEIQIVLPSRNIYGKFSNIFFLQTLHMLLNFVCFSRSDFGQNKITGQRKCLLRLFLWYFETFAT